MTFTGFKLVCLDNTNVNVVGIEVSHGAYLEIPRGTNPTTSITSMIITGAYSGITCNMNAGVYAPYVILGGPNAAEKVFFGLGITNFASITADFATIYGTGTTGSSAISGALVAYGSIRNGKIFDFQYGFQCNLFYGCMWGGINSVTHTRVSQLDFSGSTYVNINVDPK